MTEYVVQKDDPILLHDKREIASTIGMREATDEEIDECYRCTSCFDDGELMGFQ